ncbi:membrane protein [Virgisporangium aliadipatigenens]|uniref:Membrane protein n=1 Tax=Virgisporangium aliadipatigenens TaxID=741659 RepID=A0A8J3YNY2_9ACTN|nr:alpha/beta-hydrolase family protein [Virgisporangium aliadipatigenens]GIJ47897.1 membrane protein [Virgisporangium aliadipatigenens]
MRRLFRRWRYGYAGLAGAATFLCLSLTPSLLPRGHVMQGILGGVSAAIGYGLGELGAWLVRQLTGRALPRPSRAAWWWLAGAGGALVALFLWLGAGWQRDLHRLNDLPPPPRAGIPLVLLLAVATAAALVGLCRLLRRAARWLGRTLGRWIPPAAARVAGAVTVLVLALGFVDGVLVGGAYAAVDDAFRTVNGETKPDVAATTDPLRSGGPGSLVSWESLGNEGRTFVHSGPDAAALRAFTGGGAQDPIRVYVGLGASPSSRERAALAVRELERTNAFSRKVLVVVTTTGTGWVDEKAVRPLEYMYGGDTAIVATQYSYLPSWISFLVDKERARESGRDLFNAVYAAWSRRAAEVRPKLLLFGESLGSFGTEAAFTGVDDIRNRTDGMLLVGPPNRNELWRRIVADRDGGSPEILPRYAHGTTVRFAGDSVADLDEPDGAWERPRVVYLQHPSDPIVWWAPRLAVVRPDWLTEKRGSDVSPAMHWLPFVTFWQVSADLARAAAVPDGHGHNYGTAPVAGWAAVAPPDGWTPERTAALADIIAG